MSLQSITAASFGHFILQRERKFNEQPAAHTHSLTACLPACHTHPSDTLFHFAAQRQTPTQSGKLNRRCLRARCNDAFSRLWAPGLCGAELEQWQWHFVVICGASSWKTASEAATGVDAVRLERAPGHDCPIMPGIIGFAFKVTFKKAFQQIHYRPQVLLVNLLGGFMEKITLK